MSEAAFAAAIIGWHDFYLAAAGASAALLGLLFVGVSINLGAIAAQERPDLRARAGLAFSNLIYVLIVSLILLIADPEPHNGVRHEVRRQLDLVGRVGALPGDTRMKLRLPAVCFARAHITIRRRWSLPTPVFTGMIRDSNITVRMWRRSSATLVSRRRASSAI